MLKRLKDFYLAYLARRVPENDAVRLIVNKQLAKYKVDMEYVKENEKIDGEDWYNYYTFNSEKEFNSWKKFAKRIIKKTYPYLDESGINKEFSMLNLMWGLKRNYGS